ncbi:2OG-Fe(II) oxygenase [Aquamicrobium sp. LC103]|uniref:2OG-Fe(II) oxygenase n=1 Tax=Aquamicrobium sp. LC103 TaxID=1120658 RepID=UPI0010CA1429|nr:2OG-Fe(II) oxygenase [Aquamicrobium sp. LC103]TKT69902.1 2OG-Fe(II) oxygenase [Aquamicrobium sp. LC103]
MMDVLSRASRLDLQLNPFPHLVIQDALPPNLYAELSASFPPPKIIAGRQAAAKLASNRRYSMSAWPLMLREDVAAPWKTFLERHTAPDFVRTVVALFAGHWDERVASRLKIASEDGTVGLLYRDANAGGRILADARIEINAPVSADASSARGAHLDTPNRLYSGLFYLREEGDDSTGGELELFRWKSRPTEILDVNELPPDSVERVTAIPYRANQLVIFPQSIHALHGVGIRHTTPHIRRYVFITSEFEDDWLTADRRAEDMPEPV